MSPGVVAIIMRVREHELQKMWPQMRQWWRRFMSEKTRSHLRHAPHSASSTHRPETLSRRDEAEPDQLVEVVDTDEIEWRPRLVGSLRAFI